MKVRPIPSPSRKISKDGYRVWLTSHNDLGIIRYMVAMGTAHYVVMIDPASFIDVIPYSSWQIDAAIIGNAHNVVITSSDEIAQGIITKATKHPVSISKIMESFTISCPSRR